MRTQGARPPKNLYHTHIRKPTKNMNNTNTKKAKTSIPIQELGARAAVAAMPVIGCAEGIGLMMQAEAVGMLVTAYDHALADRYSECKKRKVEMGYKCMAPVFPKVSLTMDYQHWTSALKHWLDTHYQDPQTRAPPAIVQQFSKQNLVIQRCRGSEVAHTFEVWTKLLDKGGFFKHYQHTSFERVEPAEGDDLSLFVWHLKYNGTPTGCRIFFRGGWEPDRIRRLPPDCASGKDWTTVFLLGTCCRFQNCEEGDLLFPTVSIRYDVKHRVLNSKAEPLYQNWFEKHRAAIWSPANQRISRQLIKHALTFDDVAICGYVEGVFAASDERIKPAVHIQLTDIFQVESEEDTFTQAAL